MEQVMALDSMVFIYLFESDERYVDSVERIFHRIETGQANAITSVISLIEALSPKKMNEHTEIQTEIMRFFQETPNLSIVPIDEEIGLMASSLLRQNEHLRTPDAIQLATAILSGAGVFVTNDINLRKTKNGLEKIKILGLDEVMI